MDLLERGDDHSHDGPAEDLHPDGEPDHGVAHLVGREVAAVVLVTLVVAGIGVWVARRAAPDDVMDPPPAAAPPSSLTTYAGHHSATYADPAHWVCRPDLTDACDQNLDTTIIEADGSTRVEPFVADPDAPIDCFYVYPTVSRDPAVSSDLVPAADQEGAAARLQAARFGSVCRVFAPVYRQRTMTDLVGGVPKPRPQKGTTTTTGPLPYDIAYDDVLDAFKHYVANDNGGRGFVLIGQAQGSTLLNALIEREIAPNLELRDHLLSAVLAGFPATVDAGDRDAVPACRRPGQLGCIISFAAYRSTAPPPEDAAFGRGHVCTNPAALGGARAPLRSYFPTDRHLPFIDPALSSPGPPWIVGAAPTPILTPFVATPGLVEGECVVRGGFTYLEVTVNGDPRDPRTDDITGDLIPAWGLHLVDFELVMGDLLQAVRDQREAYLQR